MAPTHASKHGENPVKARQARRGSRVDGVEGKARGRKGRGDTRGRGKKRKRNRKLREREGTGE